MNEALMPFTDLMSNIKAWASRVPREALRPVFQVDPHGGPSERISNLAQPLDIICLPELINVTGLPGTSS
jgi:hypothetical protein